MFPLQLTYTEEHESSSSPTDTSSNPDVTGCESYRRSSSKSSKDLKNSPSDFNECHTPKLDKKYSHNIVEKRYRQSINSALGELQQMLFVSGTRCTKSNTLRAAIKRIKQLESINSILSEENCMLRSTISNYERPREIGHPIMPQSTQSELNNNHPYILQQTDSSNSNTFLNSIHPMAFAKQAYSFSYSFTILVLGFFLILPVFAYNLSISEYLPSLTFQSDYAYRIKSGFLVNFVILAWLRFNRLSAVDDSLQSEGSDDGTQSKIEILRKHDKNLENYKKQNDLEMVYYLNIKKLSLYGVLAEDLFDLASIIRSFYDLMFFCSSLLCCSVTKLYTFVTHSLFPRKHFGNTLNDIQQSCVELLQYHLIHPPQSLKDKLLYLFRSIKIYCFVKDRERYITQETSITLHLLCLIQIKKVFSFIGQCMLKTTQNIITNSSEDDQNSTFNQSMIWLQDQCLLELLLKMKTFTSNTCRNMCSGLGKSFNLVSFTSCIAEELLSELFTLCIGDPYSNKDKKMLVDKYLATLMKILQFLNANCEESSQLAHFYSVYLRFFRYYATNKHGIEREAMMMMEHFEIHCPLSQNHDMELKKILMTNSGTIQKILSNKKQIINHAQDLLNLVSVTHQNLRKYVGEVDAGDETLTKITILCTAKTLLKANLILKSLNLPLHRPMSVIEMYFEELDILCYYSSDYNLSNEMWSFYKEKALLILETNPIFFKECRQMILSSSF